MQTNDIFDPKSCDLACHTLLEASAGTGKTFSLSHLVLRTIVEKDIGIDQTILITFTRAATSELRGRIREKLEQTATLLLKDNPYHNENLPRILRRQFALWQDSGITPKIALERILRSLENFDNAMIETTHGFCQQMLTQYSIREHVQPSIMLLNIDKHIQDVATRCYRDYINELSQARARATFTQNLPITKFLQAVTRYVTGIKGRMTLHVGQFIAKPKADPDSRNFYRHYEALIQKVKRRFATLQRKYRWKTPDEILLRMRDEVTSDPEHNAFTQKLRENFRALFVDEFQDTDDCQYEIIRTAFMQKDYRIPVLFFVGDPKQSIYAFRNSNIHTYLRAAKEVDKKLVLKKNYRSTSGIVRGLNKFFTRNHVDAFALAGAPTQDEKITYEVVSSLRPTEGGPLPLCRVDQQGHLIPIPSFEIWSKELANTNEAKTTMAQDITNDIAFLLRKNVQIFDKDTWRPVSPNDITILVRRRSQAQELIHLLKKRLPTLGIRMQTNASVLERIEAFEVRRILLASTNETNPTLLANAMATRLMGYSAQEIALQTAGGAFETALRAREKATQQIALFRETLEQKGPTAAFETLMMRCQTAQRLLQTSQGIESLHHYEHIIRIMHEVYQNDRTTDFVQWLVNESPNTEDASQRYMERPISLDEAIHIVTVHASKGLEYPIVYCLDGTSSDIDNNRYVVRRFNTTTQKLEAYISAQSITADWSKDESINESSRISYVAFTRASRRLVIPMYHSAKPTAIRHTTNNAPQRIRYNHIAPTMKVILEKDKDNAFRRSMFADSRKIAGIAQQIQRVLDSHNHQTRRLTPQDMWSMDRQSLTQRVRADTQDRKITHVSRQHVQAAPCVPTYARWQQSSFSSLVQRTHTEYEERNDDDRMSAYDTTDTKSRGALAYLPAGPIVGNFLHKILELTHFDQRSRLDFLRERIRWAIEDYPGIRLSYQSLAPEDAPTLEEYLLDWVLAFAKQPIFAACPTLQEIPRSSWRHEWDFTLNIGWDAQDREYQKVLFSQLQKILHDAPEPYNALLPQITETNIQGFLVGSMDAVIEYGQKLYLIDWKSNRLPTYDKNAIDESMREHQYHLQYLFYCLALKRIVAMKYETDDQIWDHIGGIAYVYLRGGVDPIISYQPDMQIVRTLVNAIDRLFQGKQS